MADESHEPEALSRELKTLYAAPFSVPARVNDAILNRARAELARRRRWRPLRWAGAAVAAAACILIAVQVTLRSTADAPVTIVDALKLARQIESGGGRDINRDGIIDRRDVDALAMIAVRLEGGAQ